MKKNLDNNIFVTSESKNEDYKYVCNNLYKHNVKATNGLLKETGANIELYLKSGDGDILNVMFVILIYKRYNINSILLARYIT